MDGPIHIILSFPTAGSSPAFCRPVVMTCHLPFVNRPVAAGFFAALALVAGNAEAAFAAVDNEMLRCAHPSGCLMAGDLPAVGSLIIRRYLGYALTDQTPDHSILRVFRQRLPEEIFAAAHEVVLEGLRTHGLLKGTPPRHRQQRDGSPCQPERTGPAQCASGSSRD